MEWFIPLAAKSFIVAGGALLLLKLLNKRSAADRSWIAHLALAGLLALPVATFALPTLDVAGPEFLVGPAEVQSPSLAVPSHRTPFAESAPLSDEAGDGSARIDWPFWSYAAPAFLLVLLTLVALGRLFVLKARATVLVDAPWLTALARAQKRMGFKHGTALLTSDELPSPISWGVVRPVILLNTEASKSHAEAEAIITHELAHVAHLDWAKLLVSRVAIALFWFNPFVWLLAREAHQLREEAADDAVLATDIEGTDYARLLVGVARHECRGLLIGAHGVAPGKSSLSRRVKRVLDGAAKRAPGGWRWGSAMAFFAAGMAVPVAALNFVPAAAAESAQSPAQFARSDSPYYSSTEAESAPAMQVTQGPVRSGRSPAAAARALAAASGAKSVVTRSDGATVLRSRNGDTVTITAPDSRGHRTTVLRSRDGTTVQFAGVMPALAAAVATAPGVPRSQKNAIDRAIAMQAVGATPEYVAAMRRAAPQLGIDEGDFAALKAVGVTPAFVQELARLGYRDIDGGDIAGAYAVGVRPDYIRSLAAAGYGRLSIDELTQLRAVGVTAADIQRFRKAGYSNLDVEKLTQLKTLGISPEALRAAERYGP